MRSVMQVCDFCLHLDLCATGGVGLGKSQAGHLHPLLLTVVYTHHPSSHMFHSVASTDIYFYFYCTCTCTFTFTDMYFYLFPAATLTLGVVSSTFVSDQQ